MSVFKITYVNNKAISCSLVANKDLKGDYAFEYNKGNLIHAFVKAKDEEEAQRIARSISEDFQKNKKLPGR